MADVAVFIQKTLRINPRAIFHNRGFLRAFSRKRDKLYTKIKIVPQNPIWCVLGVSEKVKAMLYICAVPNTDKRITPKNRVKIDSYEERLEELKEEIDDGDEFSKDEYQELKEKVKEFIELAKEEDLYVFELEVEDEDFLEELERKIPGFRTIEVSE